MKPSALAVCLLVAVPVAAALAAREQEVTIHSASMNRQIPAAVILPDSYLKADKTYPVVYLLHGYRADHHQLLTETTIAAADTYQMIIFLPDGGSYSWYLDSPVQPQLKYETHIAVEVPRFADSHFRTIPHPWARAISGTSMGGYGALFIALRHKDTFGSVGSLSGVVDFRPFSQEWDLKKVLGPMELFPQRWDDYVIINNLHGLKPGQLNIYLDIGTTGDIFLESNRVLHRKLLGMEIPHVYVERPGKHDDPYFAAAIKCQLFYFSEIFSQKQNVKN